MRLRNILISMVGHYSCHRYSRLGIVQNLILVSQLAKKQAKRNPDILHQFKRNASLALARMCQDDAAMGLLPLQFRNRLNTSLKFQAAAVAAVQSHVT